MVQRPITSLPRCRLLVPHHITQPTENFDIVHLVDSFTIWCVLMVNDAFVIKENCQHHSHLALNLACIFWPRRPRVFNCDDWAYVSGSYQQT